MSEKYELKQEQTFDCGVFSLTQAIRLPHPPRRGDYVCYAPCTGAKGLVCRVEWYEKYMPRLTFEPEEWRADGDGAFESTDEFWEAERQLNVDEAASSCVEDGWEVDSRKTFWSCDRGEWQEIDPAYAGMNLYARSSFCGLFEIGAFDETIVAAEPIK